MDVELLREALMCYLGTGHGGNRFDEIDVALDALDQWAKDAKLGAAVRRMPCKCRPHSHYRCSRCRVLDDAGLMEE